MALYTDISEERIMSTEVHERPFGTVEIDDKPVEIKAFTMVNNNLQVEVINLGATITAIRCPDKTGKMEDVVLGSKDPKFYQGKTNPFFWGVTGRFTNRIRKGAFQLDGKKVQLSFNDFGTQMEHHVHGGFNSFDRLVWHGEPTRNGVVFSVVSPDGQEGYPGDLLASVTYTLDYSGQLNIHSQATTTKSTIVNISNHVYFNLGGHDSGDVLDHVMSANADKYTPDDHQFLPTGEIISVKNSVNDFLAPVAFGDVVSKCPGGDLRGICVNVCVNGHGWRQACRVKHPSSGRVITVFTDQPGLEVYTGNFFPNDGSLTGKTQKPYLQYGGFCLMSQGFPDAPNKPNFPNCVLRPGEIYSHKCSYKFSVEH